MSLLLFTHSILRWLVVISILSSIFVAWRGYMKNSPFGKGANFLRHWTATFAHIQLIVGMYLAFQSPYFSYFWKNLDDAWVNFESVFYGLLHPTLMLIAITILTVGSAKAKRKEGDREKFKTMLIWYLIAAILIFLGIPWPFSPFSQRLLIPDF